MRVPALFVILMAAAEMAQGTSISFLSNVRDVHVPAAKRQTYFVVDEELWQHARPDLADLRLFDENIQVPYALITEQGGVLNAETQGRILNLGSAGGQTEFDVDAGGIPEYDHVRLQLEAKISSALPA